MGVWQTNMIKDNFLCPICSSNTTLIGVLQGNLDGRDFNLRQCNDCFFSYVDNPRLDYQNIYNEQYYSGQGADRSVNYIFEHLYASDSIRNYEWHSLVLVFEKMRPAGGVWLDFGCGSGGLVRYASQMGKDIVGFDEGWAAKLGNSSGCSILNAADLDVMQGSFDFITAIEVLEHVANPIEILTKIRRLLKPGGVVFITTGNAKPWRKKLLKWSYARCPDVHISFYEPEVLSKCIELAGMVPKKLNFDESLIGIFKYKVLKTFNITRRNCALDFLPWGLIARVVNLRYALTDQPYGVYEDDS
jgi:SAM-dependent methyltransferase